MGFFNSLFGGKIQREDWGQISSNMVNGLEVARKQWFDLVIEAFTHTSGNDSNIEFAVIKKNLSGDGLRATKAYQLLCIAGCMAEYNYIDKHDGNDFADFIFAEMCGADLNKCLKNFGYYFEVKEDRKAQLFRFSGDIAKHITAKKAPLFETMLVGKFVTHLTILTYIVVAMSFGDTKTANLWKNKLNDIMQ